MKIEKFLERYLLLIYLGAIVLSFLFSDVGSYLNFLVSPIVFIVMYLTSLNISFDQTVRAFKEVKNLAFLLILQFVTIPLFVYVVVNGIIAERDIIIGFVFLFTLPTGIMNLFYAKLYKGDIPFSMAGVVVSSLLSPIITPTVFFLLTREIITIDFFSLLFRVFLMMTVPYLLSLATQRFRVHGFINKYASSTSTVLFAFSTFIIAGATVKAGLFGDYSMIALISVLLFGFFMISFFGTYFFVDKVINRDLASASAIMTSRRSTAMGLGIAVSIFPGGTILVLVLNIIIQNVSGLIIRYFWNR